MIREALSKTQDYYRIKGTHLAEESGISQQHWSEYRNGKADVVTAKASAALEAMERLHPGAINYFCCLLMGRSIGSDLKTLIEVADENELEEAFGLIGKRMFRKNTVESDFSTANSSVALKSK
ncbi:helix-turn-helix domain-containing protein [Microcoleus sp.]|uniref:helix-turn-helix domain-containing protein n=1 Tax=Microcoleus sp. TaxID=44472 RepID=UPI003524D989